MTIPYMPNLKFSFMKTIFSEYANSLPHENFWLLVVLPTISLLQFKISFKSPPRQSESGIPIQILFVDVSDLEVNTQTYLDLEKGPLTSDSFLSHWKRHSRDA